MAKLNLFRSLMGTFYLRLVYLDCKKFIVDVYGCITSWGEIYHEVSCVCVFESMSLFSSENKLESTYTLTRHVWNTSSKSFAVALVFVCVCTPRQKHNVSVFSLLLISGILEAWFRFFLHKNATFIQIHSGTDSLLLLRLSSTYHTAHTHIYLWEIEKTNISLLSACFSSKQFLKHDSSALQTY